MDAPAGPIDYAAPRSYRHLRRWACVVAALTVLGAVSIAARPWAVRYWNNASDVWAFNRCATYAAPPGQVVYEEDPDAAAKLISSELGYTPFIDGGQPVSGAGLIPKCWSNGFGRLCISGFGSTLEQRQEATLFLHERQTKGGRRRLVAIDYVNNTVDGGVRCYVAVLSKPSIVNGSENIGSDPKYRSEYSEFWKLLGQSEDWVPMSSPLFRRDLAGKQPFLRFYAGQPDPVDASHFGIAYMMSAQPGMIDGWLIDDPNSRMGPQSCCVRLDVRNVHEQNDGRDRLERSSLP